VYPERERSRREARQWLGYRGLFRPWVVTTFMSPADYDVIEARKAEIYAMPGKGTWSVDGVPDRGLDKLVDELTLCGTPAKVPRLGERVVPALRG
jgi:hypothetical protein